MEHITNSETRDASNFSGTETSTPANADIAPTLSEAVAFTPTKELVSQGGITEIELEIVGEEDTTPSVPESPSDLQPTQPNPDNVPGVGGDTKGLHPKYPLAEIRAGAPTEFDTSSRLVSGWVEIGWLRPHEKNAEIYGIQSTDDLEESIKKYGLRSEPKVTEDGRIYTGTRRVAAMKKLGLTHVQVRVMAFSSEMEVLAALLADNVGRIKSKSQIANECQERLRIEKSLAKTRQSVTSGKEVANLPPAKKGKSRDAAGAAVGVSGRTGDKAVTVLAAIKKLEADGKVTEAKALTEKLDKSFDGALKMAVAKGYLPPPRKKGIEATKPTPPPAPPLVPATPPAAVLTPQPTPPYTAPAQADASEMRPMPAAGINSDKALEMADEVITFLRSPQGKNLSESDKRNWWPIFRDLEKCREELSIRSI